MMLPMENLLTLADDEHSGTTDCTAIAMAECRHRATDRTIGECLDHALIIGEQHLQRDLACMRGITNKGAGNAPVGVVLET